MKLYLRQSTYFLFLIFILVGCGQPGELGLEAQPVGILSDGDEGQHEREIQEQIRTCRELAKTSQIRTHQQVIRFEDTKLESGRAQVCEFAPKDSPELNGNLTILDSFLRARYSQSKNIGLPANAVVCDMEIESAEQDFLYDDVFFLNLNNGILASNHKQQLKESLAAEVFSHTTTGRSISIYNYEWLKVRGSHFENVVNDFCIGQEEGLSECQWPVSEKRGKIKLRFDPEILIRLSQKRSGDSQQINMVITGDNDLDSDCYHQRLDLNFVVKYYIK